MLKMSNMDLKIKPKAHVKSNTRVGSKVHVVAKQTTTRGFRTRCGVYFTDTKKSKWHAVKGNITCLICRCGIKSTIKKKITKVKHG